MGMDSFPKLVFFILVGSVIAYPISGLAGIVAAIIALWCIAIFFGAISDSSSGSSRSRAPGQHQHGGHCRNRCRRRR